LFNWRLLTPSVCTKYNLKALRCYIDIVVAVAVAIAVAVAVSLSSDCGAGACNWIELAGHTFFWFE
jgi:cell division protein FtsW (lipid II flippase)